MFESFIIASGAEASHFLSLYVAAKAATHKTITLSSPPRADEGSAFCSVSPGQKQILRFAPDDNKANFSRVRHSRKATVGSRISSWPSPAARRRARTPNGIVSIGRIV